MSLKRKRAGEDGSDIVTTIRDGWSVAVRAGLKPHRYTRIWAVVVEGRVFVRSWGLASRGWYRTLRIEPYGMVQVGRKAAFFRAAHPRGERLQVAVDRAYRAKYARPSEADYVRDMCAPKSRATTTELVLEGTPRTLDSPLTRA